MLELMVAVPQLHWPAIGPREGDGDRGLVAVSLNLLDLIDVAAKAVEEIESIILHSSDPPVTSLIAVFDGSGEPGRLAGLSRTRLDVGLTRSF